MLLLRPFPILLLTFFAIFALATAGLLLHRLTAYDKPHCAGCIGYALKVNSMIDDAGDNVRGNAQFFRYAVDKACAGRLLNGGRCLEHRRGLLRDKARYFYGIEDPYAACRAISAC
ncbi:uncharacterized protein ASPGLDRAFT_181692 [Aspergillus glaucus CBS 516.65]|uniref:Saposin B-type domain-containing protein n=1 Tax=Aspergillus glaucus CBS 516.65 TaxID=1160497 RepID=A0A1L9V4T0_ASPGL|nr:hypothetical protein ASPGLDRAFT_181692 [Aspergillus glaucus CBS 516.65]OJJ78944.1 hypothetical protein ASPGLDRAFT_181692 [Aspergillus glaucus CBS 516.65]